MRSAPVQPGENIYAIQNNAERADSYGASMLMAHQQYGAIALPTNPTNGQTLTVTINGTAVVLTFVSSIGSAAGNVLIAGTAAATATNAVNLLNNPQVTSSTQVALSAGNIALASQLSWSLVGTTITPSSNNQSVYAPTTSFTASTTVTGGSYTAATLKLYVEPGVCYIGATRVIFNGGASPAFTAPVSNPRIDILTIDNTGTLAITQGAENASPVAPSYPSNKLVLAEIWNVVGETGIFDNANQQTSQGYIYNDVRQFIGGSYISTDSQVDAAANISFSKLNTGAIPAALIPDADGTRDLGSASFEWRNLYLTGTILINGISANATTSASYTTNFAVTKGSGISVYPGNGNVQNGMNPVQGSQAQFDSNAISQQAMCTMDSTHFIVVYKETTNWFVRCGVNAGGAITYGTAVQLSNTTSSVCDIVSLTSTTFVVTYGNSGSTLRAVAGTLSGTTITMGSDTTIAATSNGTSYCLVSPDSTHFVLAFSAAAQAGAVCGSVSGTTITFGSVTSMGTSAQWTALGNGISMQDGSHFVFTGNFGVIGASFSGTTITFGTQVNMNGSSSILCSNVYYLASGNFALVAAFPPNAPYWVQLYGCTISGTTVAIGSGIQTTTSNAAQFTYALEVIDSTHVILYQSNGSAAASTFICGYSISGTTVTALSGQIANANGIPLGNSNQTLKPTMKKFAYDAINSVYYVALFTFASSHSQWTIVTCSSTGQSFALGVATANFASDTGNPFNTLSLPDGAGGLAGNYTLIVGDLSNQSVYAVIKGSSYIGIAAANASAGASVNVQMSGSISSFSGLTKGSLYYLQADGTVSTTVTGWRLGYAVSASTIVVSTQW